MGNYTIFGVFENPRRGWQARNLTTNVPKILVRSQIVFLTDIFQKLTMGAPDFSGGHTVASALGDFNLKTDS